MKIVLTYRMMHEWNIEHLLKEYREYYSEHSTRFGRTRLGKKRKLSIVTFLIAKDTDIMRLAV